MKEKITKMIGKVNKNKELIFAIVSWLILIAAFFILIFFVDKKIDSFVNDDMLGDLTLGYL